jgi:cytoskeletal protein RodZ
MEQTNLNIGTIGQKLEAARTAKGVTVSEAGKATKILSKFIEAMEKDDFGALSAPVYAKSFIKMYAQYLGLEPRPLVEEYVAQHAPKSKLQLSNEARKNLAAVDEVPVDDSAVQPNKPNPVESIFGEANKAIMRLSGSGLSMKVVLSAAGGLILLAIIVLSATQCADDEEEPTAVGGAASVEREVIMEGAPDAYLVKPGVVEIEP